MRKPRTRAGMISYLSLHYTYAGRPARCIKINTITSPGSLRMRDACFAALDDYATFDMPNFHLDMFNQAHDGRYKKFWIEWEGHSNGYLALNGWVFSHIDTHYDDWLTSDLHWMTGIVWDFDKACERAVKSFLDYAQCYHMKEDNLGTSRDLRQLPCQASS